MAKMLRASSNTWKWCCSRCARKKPHEHKPNRLERRLGRAREKVAVRREMAAER